MENFQHPLMAPAFYGTVNTKLIALTAQSGKKKNYF